MEISLCSAAIAVVHRIARPILLVSAALTICSCVRVVTNPGRNIPLSPYPVVFTPGQIKSLEQIAKQSREVEVAWKKYYEHPNLGTLKDRYHAWVDLPPIPPPPECMKKGSETKFACIRYAAGLENLPYNYSYFSETAYPEPWAVIHSEP
jgi:hypothetical protein